MEISLKSLMAKRNNMIIYAILLNYKCNEPT